MRGHKVLDTGVLDMLCDARRGCLGTARASFTGACMPRRGVPLPCANLQPRAHVRTLALASPRLPCHHHHHHHHHHFHRHHYHRTPPPNPAVSAAGHGACVQHASGSQPLAHRGEQAARAALPGRVALPRLPQVGAACGGGGGRGGAACGGTGWRGRGGAGERGGREVGVVPKLPGGCGDREGRVKLTG